MVRVISTYSLFLIFSIILEKIIHIINQNIAHHIIIIENAIVASKIVCLEKTQDWIICKIARNKANAVQSLKRLSPSNINANLFGAHTSLKSAITATGSVAEIIAQKSKVKDRGI